MKRPWFSYRGNTKRYFCTAERARRWSSVGLAHRVTYPNKWIMRMGQVCSAIVAKNAREYRKLIRSMSPRAASGDDLRRLADTFTVYANGFPIGQAHDVEVSYDAPVEKRVMVPFVATWDAKVRIFEGDRELEVRDVEIGQSSVRAKVTL